MRASTPRGLFPESLAEILDRPDWFRWIQPGHLVWSCLPGDAHGILKVFSISGGVATGICITFVAESGLHYAVQGDSVKEIPKLREMFFMKPGLGDRIEVALSPVRGVVTDCSPWASIGVTPDGEDAKGCFVSKRYVRIIELLEVNLPARPPEQEKLEIEPTRDWRYVPICHREDGLPAPPRLGKIVSYDARRSCYELKDPASELKEGTLVRIRSDATRAIFVVRGISPGGRYVIEDFPMHGTTPIEARPDQLELAEALEPAQTNPCAKSEDFGDFKVCIDGEDVEPVLVAIPCPRDGCSGYLVRQDDRERCEECGYPELDRDACKIVRFGWHGTRSNSEGLVAKQIAYGHSISCIAASGERGLTLKEQREKRRHAANIFKEPGFCWRCGHSRGCMHPRKRRGER